MRVVVQVHEYVGDLDVDVRLRNPEATVGDVFAALSGRAAPEQLHVAGRWVDASCPLTDSGLHEGGTLSTVGRSAAAVASPPGPQLVVTGGLDAGQRFPLPVGCTSVGRSAAVDVTLSAPSVSRRHFQVRREDNDEVVVADLGSANGTCLDDKPVPPDGLVLCDEPVVVAGKVALSVRREPEDRPRRLDLRGNLGEGGAVPFNRPPRAPRRPAPSAVELPDRPVAKIKPQFSVASLVGPLVLAAVMVTVSGGDMRFALFSLLSPVLGVGTYVESRRRASRSTIRDHKKFERELNDLRGRLDAAAALERERLRDESPDPAEVLRRAALPSVRLWERRPVDAQSRDHSVHHDFLRLHLGTATRPWNPPVEPTHGRIPEEVAAVISRVHLVRAPLAVDLDEGGILGIVGDRDAGLALARSLLCQAAVHHGPADLTISVVVDPGREAGWDWCKWLPHTRNAGGQGPERWLSAQRESSELLLRALARDAGSGTRLFVLDSDVLLEGKNSPVRPLLRSARQQRSRPPGREPDNRVAGIVLAASEDRLPAACTMVVRLVGDEGEAVVAQADDGPDIEDVLVAGLSLESARRCARDVARFEDPELDVAGAELPDAARLLPLLELPAVDSNSIRMRWRAGGDDPGLVTPLGITEQGVFTLDLVRHGSHGLVGGTTGSGKSELLRSLVAGLAAHADPTKLTFVLIDYKGGATFDACARLPHTVGVVTDLDEQLGQRALRALEAELRYREKLLRDARVDNLPAYLATGPSEPMPRLVLVVDEFATMAHDLPEFMSSLVSIAQRGRTLGVHMILATQRPGGVVKEDIAANTNLKIALRVQRPVDSVDVIGVPDAALIPATRPGRAYVRLGATEIVALQTALVTCVTRESADAPVAVVPFTFGPDAPAVAEEPEEDGARSDLARLVDAIAAAAGAERIPAPRRPWPEPLPRVVGFEQLGEDSGSASTRALFALADDPDEQRQFPAGWDLRDGNLLLVGNPGSGTTTALLSLAVRFAAESTPDELELLVLDFGAGEVSTALGNLPHVAAVVGPGERERQARLLRHVRAELDRRRATRSAGAVRPRTLVLVDGLGALRGEFNDADGLDLLDDFYRVFADGREVGLHVAITADRVGSLPSAITAVTDQKWVFRLAEAHEYAVLGVDAAMAPSPSVPGRAVLSTVRRQVRVAMQVQVAVPATDWKAEIARVASAYAHAPRRDVVQALPTDIPLESLQALADLEGEPWRIPVGRRESDLGVAELVLYEGEHALIAGPARSGTSTALLTVASALREAAQVRGLDLLILGTGGRRCPLRRSTLLDRYAVEGEHAPLLAEARTATGPVVLLVDDAQDFADEDSAFESLLALRQPNLHVIAAGRAEDLRKLYGHWTGAVRRAKAGLLLLPNLSMDGDLLGASLPLRTPVPLLVGRGFLVQGGDRELVHVAGARSDLSRDIADATRANCQGSR